MQKKAILLVAYGTTTPDSHQSLMFFEKIIKNIYPTFLIKWAFTSKKILSNPTLDKKKFTSVSEAFSQMSLEKFNSIGVQPLHIIPGTEYAQLKKEIMTLSDINNMRTTIGSPLLSSQKDIAKATSALLYHVPSERKKNEAIIYMGHGSHNKADKQYTSLAKNVSGKDPYIYIGTLEDKETLNSIIKKIVATKIRQVWLLPLLSVIGKHAIFDMAGDHEKSWKSQIEQAGIICHPVLQGILGYQQFAEIWAEHLAEAMQPLSLS